MRRLVLSSLKPRAGTGMAFNQSDERSEATAKSRAFSDGVVWLFRRSWYFFSCKGVSHNACTEEVAGCTALLLRASVQAFLASSSSS